MDHAMSSAFLQVLTDEPQSALVLTQRQWDDLAAICVAYRSAVGCGGDMRFIEERSPDVQKRIRLAREIERLA